jgi:hypothetical protein
VDNYDGYKRLTVSTRDPHFRKGKCVVAITVGDDRPNVPWDADVELSYDEAMEFAGRIIEAARVAVKKSTKLKRSS